MLLVLLKINVADLYPDLYPDGFRSDLVLSGRSDPDPNSTLKKYRHYFSIFLHIKYCLKYSYYSIFYFECHMSKSGEKTLDISWKS